MSGNDLKEERLVGKRIEAVERIGHDSLPKEDGPYLRLTFDDGSVAEVGGGGYDGLWDDVYVDWSE